MYRIGVDLGGTNIVVGIIDENNRIVAKAQRKTNAPRPAEAIFDDMADAIREAMEKLGVTKDDIRSIGVGTPGSVNKALELSRAEKRIGKPLDARVTLYAKEEAAKVLDTLDAKALPALFIVSEAEIVSGEGEGVPGENLPGLTVKVESSTLPKCERCWTHSDTVGSDSAHPTLCARCAAAVR